MQCDKIQKQFYGLEAGELTPEETHKVREHINSCESCAKEFKTFQHIWLKVAEMPQQEPSERLAVNFKSMLAAYQQGLAATLLPEPGWSAIRESLGKLFPKSAVRLAFSMALVLIGFGLGVFYNTGTVNRQQVQQLSEELDDMRELVMLSMLKQESSVDRLQGVQWSQQLEHPKPEIREALQRTLKTDPNTNVRLAALQALQPYAHDATVRRNIVNSFYEQKSPLVQIQIVDFIKQSEDRPAELLKLLEQDNNVNRAVRQHIKWTIGTLEGRTLLQESNHAKIRY